MSGIGTNYSAPSALQYEALKTSLNERIKNAFQAQQDEKRAAEFAAAQLSPASRSAETKAAAAQRVQQIKDQIRMLTMMGGVGDPKANARQITQLAKELAAAVREYASAGDATADAGQGAPASTATATGTETAAATAAPATGTATTATSTVSDETGTAATATSATPAATPDQQQVKDGIAGSMPGANPSSQADQAFITEVRDLAEKLKALARQQQARMQQGDQNGDLSATREAIAEIGNSLSNIATQTTHPSVNIFA